MDHRSVLTESLPVDENRDDRRPRAYRQHCHALRCRGRSPEERHEDALAARGVLIQEDRHHPAAIEGGQDRPERRALVDQLDPRPPPQLTRHHVEPVGVERPNDDCRRDTRELVAQRHQLPVPEMGGQDERSSMLGDRILEVLEADDRDARHGLLRRHRHRLAQFDEHQPQMLERPAADSSSFGPRPYRGTRLRGWPSPADGGPGAQSTRGRRSHGPATSPAAWGSARRRSRSAEKIRPNAADAPGGSRRRWG